MRAGWPRYEGCVLGPNVEGGLAVLGGAAGIVVDGARVVPGITVPPQDAAGAAGAQAPPGHAPGATAVGVAMPGEP